MLGKTFAQLRSDFLDIFLSAQCSFFVGSGAGIDMVSKIFRRPWARVNLIPLETVSGSARDVFIPKNLWLRGERRFLTFRETIETGLGRAAGSQDYESADVEILNNTPEEITALVLEMDVRIKGTWKETDEDRDLQSRFRDIFGSSDMQGTVIPRVGADFLRQNRDLLN